MSLCPVSHFIYCYAEYRYAECRYSECRYAECRGTEISGIFIDLVVLSRLNVMGIKLIKIIDEIFKQVWHLKKQLWETKMFIKNVENFIVHKSKKTSPLITIETFPRFLVLFVLFFIK